MKKLAIILAFLMLVPGAAFGLEMMNDSAMDDVTGQAGVSIAMDDIQIFMNIERLAWMDTDGFTTASDGYGNEEGSAGAVGINNFQLDTLQVNAITNSDNEDFAVVGDADSAFNLGSTGNLDLNFDYASTTALGFGQLATADYGSGAGGTLGLDNYEDPSEVPGGDAVEYRALTIDATSQLPALTQGKNNNAGGDTYNVGGVLIGLPTMEVYIPNMQFTPVFFNVEGAAEAINDFANSGDIEDASYGYTDSEAATYGTVVMEGITFTTLSGWVEIAPH